MKTTTKITLSIICSLNALLAQYDFSLTDLNPNSESFGDTIGPGDYPNEIRIIFFGHEY